MRFRAIAICIVFAVLVAILLPLTGGGDTPSLAPPSKVLKTRSFDKLKASKLPAQNGLLNYTLVALTVPLPVVPTTTTTAPPPPPPTTTTTVAPTPTTTTTVAATPVTQAAPAAAPSEESNSSIWDCIIAHESGGNPAAVNSSSGAGGLFQFLPSSWIDYGGGAYASLPEYASASAQWTIALHAQAVSGWYPWAGDGCTPVG